MFPPGRREREAVHSAVGAAILYGLVQPAWRWPGQLAPRADRRSEPSLHTGDDSLGCHGGQAYVGVHEGDDVLGHGHLAGRVEDVTNVWRGSVVANFCAVARRLHLAVDHVECAKMIIPRLLGQRVPRVDPVYALVREDDLWRGLRRPVHGGLGARAVVA